MSEAAALQLRFDGRWLQSVFLFSLRLGPLFVLAPVFGFADFPVRLRILLVFAFAVLLVAAVAPAPPPPLTGTGALFAAAAGELTLGAALAFGLMAAFAAFEFGGRVLDIQIGFGVATLFDPASRAQGPLLGTAFNLLAIAVFFAVDGHHAIVRAVADSMIRVPPGAGLEHLDVGVMVAQFGSMFGFGLALIAPALVALLLLDIAFAVVARTMPQMNIFIVSMPIKVAIGLFVMALAMRSLGPLLQQVFGALPDYWRQVVR
ncbi:MAG: flagellar biosynthetic protein FliR [Rhizobacter sp.]